MLLTSFQKLTRSVLPRRRRTARNRLRNSVSIECLEQRILLSNNPLDEVEPNDDAATAQVLPLGFDAGEETQLVVGGSISPGGDQDWYELQLNAGDVLGVTVEGNNQLDATLSLLSAEQELLIFNDNHRYIAHNFYTPNESPLPGLNSENSEDSLIQYVIGTSGTYYLNVGANPGTTGGYKLTSVIARPGLESEPAGAKQILFVDFDGARVNMNQFFNGTTVGQTDLSPLSRFLPLWGLDASDEDALIDEILYNIEKDFQHVLDSGVNPNADVLILNSRDHADEFGTNPYVSRLIIGGTQEEASVEEFNVPIFAFAQHIDAGNYDFDDQAIVLLDEFSGMIPGDFNYAFDLNRVPLKKDTKELKIEMLGKAIGNVGSHEIGHNLGNYHTDSVRLAYLNPGIMDNGDPRGFHHAAPGVGPDGVYGTNDDEDRNFIEDVYHPGEPFEGVGVNDTLSTTAFGLMTGQSSLAASATVDSATTSLSDSGTITFQTTLSTSTDQSLASGVNLIDDFAGQAFADKSAEPLLPPDTHLAVGQNHIVEVVNSYFAIYNKQSGTEISSQHFQDFFAEAGAGQQDGPNGVFVGFDPKVAYDEIAGRFIITALEVNPLTQTSHLLIAVSDDSNPVGKWEKHRIDAEDAGMYWADYTALGWDADAYYVTVNMFGWKNTSYHHHSVFTLEKDSLLDGDTETVTYFDVDRNAKHFTMWPALMHAAEPGDPMYFVEGATGDVGSMIRVTRMTNKLSANPTFSDFNIQVPNYSWIVNPTQPDGSNFRITNIGTRILSAAWRNDRLVAGHHVGIDGLARARWYEIDTGSASPALVQSGEIDPGPGIHTYLPSLDIAPNGDLGMTYVQSSTETGDANGSGLG